MSVNLWGGIKTNGAQNSTAKKLTANKESELKSEFRNLFEAKKETTAKVESKDGDTLTISQNGTITQKLEELKKLHEQTDYSGMTDVEKYRLISNRYDEVFPCIAGKLATNFQTYDPVAKQQISELGEIIPGYPHAERFSNEKFSGFYKEVKGYQNLSDKEIIEKTKELYSKEGSLPEKVQMMSELWALGVIDGQTYGIFDASLGYLERKEYRNTFKVFNVDEQSDHYKNWIKSGGMENLKIDWEELKNNLFQNIDVKKLYGDKKQKEIENIFEILGGK
ncbi:hypothetical protein [Aminipila terrae]|uniref:Uncharacterized protein n=1 Tax=Aminipila terrae TaxID=2697030 RepID=A0A6P1MJL3_9FIRM|nr:hypothetical protein [Aminipila terrae]QHI72208.1 hypothetical protein Ami3637_07165 [Aminipila terrae]